MDELTFLAGRISRLADRQYDAGDTERADRLSDAAADLYDLAAEEHAATVPVLVLPFGGDPDLTAGG